MPALVSLITSLVSGEVKHRVDDIKQRAIVFSVVGALALVGLVFLLVAGYIALAAYVGALYSALIVAGVFLVVALIVLGIWTLNHRRAVKRWESQRPDATDIITASAVSLAPVVLKSRLLVSLAIPAAGAIGAYMLFSRRPSRPSRRPTRSRESRWAPPPADRWEE